MHLRNQKKEKNSKEEKMESDTQTKIREGQPNSAIEKNDLKKNSPYPGLSEKDIQYKNQEEFETMPVSVPKNNVE